MNTPVQDHEPAGSKLRYDKEREATETAYAAFRCAGPRGCGERITFDSLSMHAAKQHDLFDYDVVNKINGE